jgi:iron complex outermembrane receptor protein
MNKGLSKAARRRLPALMLSGICSTSLQAQQSDNPAPAAGQASTPPVAASRPASAPGGTLQEVVITAQKVRQNLQKVSTSTAVVNGEEIQERGLNRLDTVIEGTPGVVVQTQPRDYLVAVRGLGTDLSPGVGDGAVAINVDGAYNARPEGTQVMYDLARVEVLRGPQSTYYGRSGPGGVVNIISNDPVFRKQASLGLELGSHGTRRAEGMINRPLSETVALRVAANVLQHDGYLNNGTSDSDQKSARIKLLVSKEAVKKGGMPASMATRCVCCRTIRSAVEKARRVLGSVVRRGPAPHRLRRRETTSCAGSCTCADQ